METFRQLWTTTLPSMTGILCFSSFYLWIIKLLYLFLQLIIQIWSQNHNCNVLNVFLSFLAIIMRGERTVREQSENGQSILWPLSQLGPLGILNKINQIAYTDSENIKQVLSLLSLSQLNATSRKSNKDILENNLPNNNLPIQPTKMTLSTNQPVSQMQKEIWLNYWEVNSQEMQDI